jgi:hypothetical protein
MENGYQRNASGIQGGIENLGEEAMEGGNRRQAEAGTPRAIGKDPDRES